MKNTSLIIALAALSLASCSDDEPSGTSGRSLADNSISFRSGMATRASETNNSNLKSIYVTAFTGGKEYFNDINFTKGSDSFFTSRTKIDWISDNSQIDFYAYAPSMDELGADIIVGSESDASAQDIRLESFTTPDEIADQVDFITANASGNMKDNQDTGVELTFDHRLSQIELRAITNDTVYEYKVAGMRIGRPETTGSFDFSTNTWTLDDWHDTGVYTSYCDTIILNSTPQSIMGPSGNAMLIPQTLTPWDVTGDPDNVAREAYLSVLVQITRKDNGFRMYPFPSDTTLDSTGKIREFGWASIPLSGTWEQGKHYIYTLDFTNGAGNVDPDDPNPGKPVLGKDLKFTVTVNDWTEAPSTIPMTEKF